MWQRCFARIAVSLFAQFAFVVALHAEDFSIERRKIIIDEITAQSWKDPQLNQRVDLFARQALVSIKNKNQVAGGKAASIARAEIIQGITDVYASLLDKNFSTQELQEVATFLKSSAGQKYSTKLSTELLSGIKDATPRIQENIERVLSNVSREELDSLHFSDKGEAVIYSEDFGNFYINAQLYLRKEGSRTFRGRIVSEYKHGSAFSYFLFCSARLLARTEGADSWALSIIKGDPEPYVIGLLGKDERNDVNFVLGKRFHEAIIESTEKPTTVSMCTKGKYK